MNQDTNLVKALPIVAKALGRNMGVRVEVDAGHPRTNGKVIYLPSLPLDDPGVETLGLGFIIHEAGHIRYSDFEIDYRKYSPIVVKLSGILEDIRMEQCIIRDYAGAQKKLAALVDKLVQDGFFEPVKDDSSPAATLCGYLLYKMRARVLGQSALDGLALNAQTRLEQLMTKQAMTRINSVMARVTNTKNEREIVELALEISEILEQESQRDTPPQNSDPNQSQQTGDDSQSQSPDDSQSQTDTSDDDDSDGDGQADDDDQDSSTGAGETQQSDDDGDQDADADTSSGEQSDADGDMDTTAGGNQAGDDPDDQDAFEAAKQAMKDILATSDSDAEDLPGDISDAFEDLINDEVQEAAGRGNHTVNMQPNHVSEFHKPGDHQRALDESQAATAALRTRMIQLVQAQNKAKRKTSRHGRRLNDRKLHRIKSGNLSVFKSVSRRKAVNTTVQVLLDKSYSMDEDIQTATMSTLSLTTALKEVPHVSASAAMFPGIQEAAVTELTRHDQTMHQTAGYYPKVAVNGGTPLLPALLWSGDNLMAQKQERKILLVVTDGAPDAMPECVEMIDKLKKSGIEVYGIGLGLEQGLMSNLFGQDKVMIQNVGELAGATFSLLERTILAA